MISMLDEFQIGNMFENKCTIWKSTDGYCKQYPCGVSLYFLSLLSFNYDITIYIMIGWPGYNKDIVDAINTCVK